MTDPPLREYLERLTISLEHMQSHIMHLEHVLRHSNIVHDGLPWNLNCALPQLPYGPHVEPSAVIPPPRADVGATLSEPDPCSCEEALELRRTLAEVERGYRRWWSERCTAQEFKALIIIGRALGIYPAGPEP